MVKKMGIQTWVGKRGLGHDGVAPCGFELHVVEAKKQSLEKDLEQNQKDLGDVEATETM